MTFTVVYKGKGMIDGFSYNEESEAIEINHALLAKAVNPKTINQIFLAVNLDGDLDSSQGFQNTLDYLNRFPSQYINRVIQRRQSNYHLHRGVGLLSGVLPLARQTLPIWL
jgi:hypothetical protein